MCRCAAAATVLPQASLPFKSKPKEEAKRKRKTLEQKRAVVLEPQERKQVRGPGAGEWGGRSRGSRGRDEPLGVMTGDC